MDKNNVIEISNLTKEFKLYKDKANTLKEGVQLALEQIQSGKALSQLEKFQKASNRE
jgi:anthranilate phosphoribosyltransferase